MEPRQTRTEVDRRDLEFRRFWLKHNRALYRIALHFTGSRAAAEDALQEILMAVHRSLPTFRGEAGLETWLHAVAINTCKSLRRMEPPAMLSFDEASKSDAFADECRDPEDVCAGVEAKIDLARLLSTLTREQATVTALFHLEGRDYREIATILKVPVGSVCTLLYRARRRLRKQIQRPEGNEP